MLAVVLAGGFGTRLRPLTFTTPKPLLPVANKPLVEHSIQALPREFGEVVLAVGYKAELLEDHFRRHPVPGRTVRVVVEDRPLGTGGAIANAVREAGGVSETFAVRNADLVDTLPMQDMLAHHRRSRALATISLWPVDDPSPFGVVKMTGTRIETFVEKPKRTEAPSNLINAGTYLLEPEVLEYVPEQPEGELSMERVVFPELVATSRGMQGFAFRGHWVDCGRPDAYLEAHRLLLGAGPTLAQGARCAGQVKGFACLGANAVVEDGAGLEDSVLLAGARVGRGATVVRSVLGAGARVGAGARLEDAVLGDGAEAPPNATLKGARIPEVAA